MATCSGAMDMHGGPALEVEDRTLCTCFSGCISFRRRQWRAKLSSETDGNCAFGGGRASERAREGEGEGEGERMFSIKNKIFIFDLGEHEQGRERRHVLELHEEGEGAGPQDYEDDVGAVRVLLGEGREHVVDDGREGDGEEDEVGDAVADLTEKNDEIREGQARRSPQCEGHVRYADYISTTRLLQVALVPDQELCSVVGDKCDENNE
mmetsp:Transcript_4857/g.15108  ORF Transcript_4857/g.15108 Transcript_4857/m.15108 type:complete len:209 (+) Transcript_4857:2317-2943(+)